MTHAQLLADAGLFRSLSNTMEKSQSNSSSKIIFISKIFKSILHEQINNFLDHNNILHSSQSGFRKGHSCITALANVTEDIRKEINNNKIVVLTLLDHSKGFDSLDHRILCLKLEKFYSFASRAVGFIKSYLNKRSQAVSIREETSSLLEAFHKAQFWVHCCLRYT